MTNDENLKNQEQEQENQSVDVQQNEDQTTEETNQVKEETETQPEAVENSKDESADEAKDEAKEAEPKVEEAVTSESSEEKSETQSDTEEVETKEEAKQESRTHIAKNIEPLDEFDWDGFEEGEEEYTTDQRKELSELYTQNLSTIEKREMVTGRVVHISDRDVVLNIGFKSDGLVPLSEFKNLDDLSVGDEVEVLVENPEDENGELQLSFKKAQAEKAWDTIVDAHENDKILKGHIKDRTKGGMVVDLLGMDAFMPGSQIDIKPIKDYDAFVGQTMDIKVVKLNHAFRNIVVSHKAIIESDLEEQKSLILSKLEKGQVLEGTVKNLTTFGVFVDLGGVDGLIHITDVSWGRINHPEEILELGQKINTVVLDYDEEKKRISLGLKQLEAHPWESLPEDIGEGSKVKGKVVNIEDYGAFIEIHPGVEGLIHVSEMSWSTHLKSPEEYVKMGDEVEAVVLTIDREDRKLSLGMKQLTDDPWQGIEEKYPIGSKHEGIVRSITNFGLFVELEEGIDGLVHISDLSWIKKYNHPNEFTNVGDKMELVVLEIDMENRRLSLGAKQLEEDPWDTFESIFLLDSVHEGEIKNVEDSGAIVILPYGVEAFAPKKHLMKEDKSKVQPGEKLEFRIIEFDKGNRNIVISHTDIWKEEERKKRAADQKTKAKEQAETEKEVKKVRSKVKDSTIQEETNVLADLKKKMEEEELKKQKEAIEKMDKKMKPEDEEAAAEEGEEKKEEEEEKKPKKTTASKTKKKASSSTAKTKAKKKSEEEEDDKESSEEESKE